MKRFAAGLATGAVLVSGLAACGADDEEPGPPKPEEAEQGERLDAEEFLDALERSFADGSSARVAFDVAGPTGLRGRGVVRYDADGMDVDLRLRDWQVAGGWVSLRTVDDVTYLRTPESRGLWVDLSAGEGELPGAVMEEADPRTELEALRDDVTEVRFTGDDTVAGVSARRYQLVAEGEEGAAGPTVTEYWFDQDGRVVRRSIDLGDSGRATFSWSDWGDPAVIAPPPSNKIVTLRELERLRRQGQERR